MAAPQEPAAAPTRHLRIEAIQTITPMKEVKPGCPRPIASATPLTAATLTSHLRVILYYKRTGTDDSGWAVAAWLKESVNAALPEQPLLAGRLRRGDDGEGLEIRPNDAGVRLVQAEADGTMAEFLAADDREAKEAHLAHWVDVDQENPQFSALFNVQVTSFQDDGYAIGMSCSLLLADPVCVFGFLETWAQVHARLQAQDHFSKTSIFHLGNFQRAGGASYLKSIPMHALHGYTPRTVLFDHPAGDADEHVVVATAAACLEEAARTVEGKVEKAPEFSLIVSGVDRSTELKVDESCVKALPKSSGGSVRSPSMVDWGRLHADKLAVCKDNMPVHVSYNVLGGGDRPLVVVMPPLEEGGLGLISVTFPKKVQ